ncbi:MAG: iron ABC transporter permease [Chitinophagaceae bacterium]|nr:iron ABC transporter permease [Chitinophagaceae bacterium]
MNAQQKTITVVILISLIVISSISLTYGNYKIDFNIILNWFCSKLRLTTNILWTEEQSIILSGIRLPRIVLVSLVGSSLAVAGSVLQSIFKNPLVSPYILGVSAGASFGVSIVIVFFQSYNFLFLQSFAFIFGVVAVLSVLLVSRLFSSGNTITLVLSGVIISAFFSSLVSLLQYFSEEQQLQSILYWTFGSFNNSSWKDVVLVSPLNIICTTILITQSWRINVLSLGEQESQVLGIDTNKFRIMLIGITTLLTSSVTAVCGPIGWIGLLIPHVVRFIGGANNFYVIINSFLLGAVFLQVVDLIARNIASVEIPVGIVTAIVGLPFFIFILYKSKSS